MCSPGGQLIRTRNGTFDLAHWFNRVSAPLSDRLPNSMTTDGVTYERYLPPIECVNAPILASQQSKRLVDQPVSSL